MNLLPELAGKIVQEVCQVLKEDLIVVDQHSMIIASTQEDRIGTYHEGANRVLDTKKRLHIDETMVHTLKGVREGINMPVMLGTSIVGVIGITGRPKTVEPYAEVIRKMTELIIREAYMTEQLEWKMRSLESYCYEWVNEKAIDEEFIERGRLLGIPMDHRHVCCMLQLDISHVQESEANWIQKDMFELFARHFSSDHTFIVRWGQGKYLIVKSFETSFSRKEFEIQLKEIQQNYLFRYNMKVFAGIGRAAQSNVIQPSFTEAKKALKIAEKRQEAVFYEDLMLDVILEEIPSQIQEEFMKRTLCTLLESHDLLETLQTFLEQNLSIKDTAKAMHLHINSLHYRLKQIKELTGIDPRKTEGIAFFYLAVHFYHNQKHVSGEKGEYSVRTLTRQK
ncbi:CdaR family transcriptional regulator [Bacillus massiliglaciei]|uniref:CdaR family transcriptional regulator n=1 Tax=Bacillus massiliglaciei TaxID=1816693 RepID=UPI000DA63123|nr:sugar diacid recognition domain-containing protein [Bacillus massiliglaciei]